CFDCNATYSQHIYWRRARFIPNFQGSIMRLDRIGITCGFALAIGMLPTPSALASSYDGQWTGTITTMAGDCQPTAIYPLVVSEGKVSASGNSEVSGKVSPAGLVRVSLQGAHASGQLSGNSGARS